MSKRNILKRLFIASLLLMFFTISIYAEDSSVKLELEAYTTTYNNDESNLSFNNLAFSKVDNSFKLDSKEGVWIKLDVYNLLSKDVQKSLFFDSYLIDKLKVYRYTNNKFIMVSDLSFKKRAKGAIYPYFNIKLKPKDISSYYLFVASKYIPLKFKINIGSKDSYLEVNNSKIIYYTLGFSILSFVAIIFIFLYFYKKENIYALFSLILSILTSLYLTYSGLCSFILPIKFIQLLEAMSGILLNSLAILLSIYSILFFKIDRESIFYKLYIYIIYFSIFNIIINGFFSLYYLVIPILIVLPVFNVYVGFIYLKKGYKEAIFYLLANISIIVLVASYLLDVDNSSYYLLFLLASVLLFSLSFFYRYIEREISEEKLFISALEKKLILNGKIDELEAKLDELKQSEDEIRKSINITIKDNLHMILTMAKLGSKGGEEIDRLNRRVAIFVNIYSLFLAINKREDIDMGIYLPLVLDYIKSVYQSSSKVVKIKRKIDAKVTLSEAINISVTVANMLINSYEDKSSLKSRLSIELVNIDKDYKLSIKELDNSFIKRVERQVSLLVG